MKDGGVHYARNGSVRLAYRVLGEGDTTLVWNPGWFSNVDLWTDPSLPFVPFVEGLARGTRLVMWDKRGTGLSDPVTHVPPLDERMDDLQAVMDAVGADAAALFGVSEGGPMSVLFAATYPERVQSLALYGTLARFTPELPDHPWGFTADQTRAIIEEIESHWGEGALADLFFGPIADVPGFREIYGRAQRAGASPTMCLMLWQALLDSDVGGVLSSVRTPTLVLGRDGDGVAPVEGAKSLAAAMPNAQFLQLPPGPHALMDDDLAATVVNFVCGKPAEDPGERVLSTVFSPTSSARRNKSARKAMRSGAISSMRTTSLWTGCWRSTAAAASSTPATASLRCSTARPRRRAAVSTWFRPSPPGASASASGSTPVNASGAATSGADWQSM